MPQDPQLAQLLANPFISNALAGRFVLPLGTAARTDVGADGEVHAYVSGGSIILSVYSKSLAAWQSETLS